jgi:hypothetical protein
MFGIPRGFATAGAIGLGLASAAHANDSMIALVPGGPHLLLWRAR